MPIAREPRLLFVEDNEDDYLLTARLLRNTPFQVTWLQSLKEALADAKNFKFDAILLDLDLMDSFGLETLEQVQRKICDTPIVILTGNESDERALEALQRGAQDYLVKNRINSDNLLRSIRYAIERHRLDQRLRWIIRKLVWLNDQVVHTKDQALEELRRSRELLVVASHEIRTPLGAVLGFAELLAGEDLQAEPRSLADRLFIAAKKLAVGVNSVLDLSNLAARRSEPDIKFCSVRSILHDVSEILKPLAEGKGVSLETVVADNIPNAINSDPIRLQQAILSFTHRILSSTVETNVIIEACISESDVPTVRICVSDLPGVHDHDPCSDLQTLVDAEQVNVQNDPDLGLTIAKASIEMMGGRVGYASDHKGSRIWLAVPFKP